VLIKTGGDEGLRLSGFIQVKAWKRGRLLWTLERENLIVTAGKTPVAKLIGGTVSNESVTAIGFGSGTTAPAITDTDLGATPAYYKALGTVTFPAAQQVQFAWSLSGSSDSGAVGMNVQEVALFCNTGAVSLPITRPSGAAPAMTMFAHQLFPLGTIGAGTNYTATWLITVN